MRALKLMALLTCMIGCRGSAESDPFRLGLVADAVGDSELERGAIWAIQELNERPQAVIGSRPVSLRIAPGGQKPAAVAAQASRLQTLNRVDAMIAGTRTADAAAVGTSLQNTRALVISPAGSAGPSGLVYSIGVSPSERSRAMADHIVHRFGDRRKIRIVLVRDARHDDPDVLKEFRRRMAATAEWVELGTAGNVGEIDAVVTADPPSTLNAIRSGFPKATFYTLADETEWDAGGRIDFECFGATAYPQPLPTTGMKALADRRDNGGKPCHGRVFLGYDAVMIWAEAVARAESSDPARVSAVLKTPGKPFPTLTGSFEFSADRTLKRPGYAVTVPQAPVPNPIPMAR